MNAPSCKARNTRKCWKKRNCEIRVWKNLYYFWQPAPEDTILIYNCYRSDRRIMYVNHFNQIYRHIICKLFQHTIIDCEFSFRVSSERKAYNFKMLRNLGQSTAAPDLKKSNIFRFFELATCSILSWPHAPCAFSHTEGHFLHSVFQTSHILFFLTSRVFCPLFCRFCVTS